MDVSIVIVSWKVKDLLKVCLTSVYRETKNLEFEVFVVDNNSDDGTIEMVRQEFPKVQLIANEKNYGFARACNQAIKKSSGKFVLLLNPDTELTCNAILATFQFMQQISNNGITGCKILDNMGKVQPSVRKFPDFISHILILLKLHNFFPNLRSLGNYYLKDWDYSKSSEVDQVMGAFYMIKREVLIQVGLLNENFYIWYEEVDLCKRALQAGWKTYYFSGATILHQKAQSFGQKSSWAKQLVFNRSMIYYFYKHHSFYEYFILLLLYPLSLLLALLVQLFNIKKSHKDL